MHTLWLCDEVIRASHNSAKHQQASRNSAILPT